MNKIAIIGYGWVGKAMHNLFPNAFIYSRNVAYDSDGQLVLNSSKENWEKYYKEEYKNTVNNANIVFICVPTPNIYQEPYNGEGMLDTSIIEECISWIEAPLIVIRSTVNPGDCEKWSFKYKKQIVMQPEYLGETPAHPLLNTIETPFLIIGGSVEDRKKLIDVYTEVYNANVNIKQVSLYEAEVIKLSENRAIAFKVAQCQELYDVCEKIGLDYYTIRDAVYGDDPRFNLWWTFVYPKKRGFNSKCIPKDVYAWCAWAESLGYKPEITRGILNKNKEWIMKNVDD